MTDCIVIGGGIIGMLTAHNLCLEGASVTLLEKAETGRESSWAGGGIISPLYPWRYKDSITRLATWGQQQYPQLCEKLYAETGIDPEYTVNGLLILSPDEEAQAKTWAEKFRQDLSIIPGSEIEQTEPRLQTTQTSAIWLKHIAQVRNPRLTKALRQILRQQGVTIITEAEVNDFITGKHRLLGINSTRGKFSADHYAVCTGAWTGKLLEPLGTPPPIQPVQGQMILFKTGPGCISRITLEQDRYIIPRRDGRVLFGSTVEQVDFNKHITETAKQELYRIAIERFPVLEKFPVEHHWAGLRPGTPEGVPVISSHPDYDNLFINAGHFRNGVVLAPASCRLMTDMIQGKPEILPGEDYRLVKPD